MKTNFRGIYNILCIDDNENNLFTLDALLKTSSNIMPILADSADKGLKILLKKRIDLILLDVQMPIMNGFETAKLIKSNKKTRDIPIIFITAVFKSEEFIKEGFDIGAVDYLTKPIDDIQLLNKITLYLKIFDKNRLLQQSEKRFYDIAQSIGDGIYTVNNDLKTTFVNKSALDLLGFESNELVGKNIHDIIHYKDENNNPINFVDCKMHNVLLDGQRYTSDKDFLIKKDGSFLPVSVIATPLHVDNKIAGLVTIFHDKTDQNKIIKLKRDKIKNQEQIIHSMVAMIESRDSYTAGHTKRVARYCEMIAIGMGYTHKEIELVKNAAWLHDIGKISTPDNILLKPTKLTRIEYELIQDHLSAGYNMLKEIDEYKEIAGIMYEHHEKYDGTGYPNGLKADEIRPLSRIMILADAFDAMTTNRVYKPRKSVKVAIEELKNLSAVQFHPEVVDVAVKILKDIDIDNSISQLPKSKIEEQRFSYFYKDHLTNLFIIEYLQLILTYHDVSDMLYFYSIKLHNFSEFNRKYGWSEGDKFLISFAKYLKKMFAENLIFRVEGDDFLILSESKIEDIEMKIAECEERKRFNIGFSIEEEYQKAHNYKV